MRLRTFLFFFIVLTFCVNIGADYPPVCQDGFPWEYIECKIWKLEYWKIADYPDGQKYTKFLQFDPTLNHVFTKIKGTQPSNCYGTFVGDYIELPTPWGQIVLQFQIKKDLYLFTYDYIGIHLYCGNGYTYISGQKYDIYATMTNVTQFWLICFPYNWTWPWDGCPW